MIRKFLENLEKYDIYNKILWVMKEMKRFIKENMEPNKKIRAIELIVLAIIVCVAAVSIVIGTVKLNQDLGQVHFSGTIEMERDFSLEDYDENCTMCDVTYVAGQQVLVVSYPYEQYVELDTDSIIGYQYENEEGIVVVLDHANATKQEVTTVYQQIRANEMIPLFNLANALIILAIAFGVVIFFAKVFTTYEKCWFMSIMILATIVAVMFPEESANGVNGIVIMLLYLLDTFLNILCELLISKQSRYNFLVSVAVEITEIVICLVLMYRFATMVTTLFFWLPIDIISFINWSKHKDQKEDELTVVRRLKGYQEVLVILAIVVWTMVVGYFLSGLDIQSDFIQNRSMEVAIAYIDACASAVGVANGLFILFRFREQWIAWYICAILESAINIISGQYVLLVLKFGYITNTTYGYIKWSKYIKSHKEEKLTLF